MDNPLTPNKIQRLMHLAEDKSFPSQRKLPQKDKYRLSRLGPQNHLLVFNTFPSDKHNQEHLHKSASEFSSGLLDLDRVEGFGESKMENISLNKSTAFRPGEMTGRSTGADEGDANTITYGRHSLTIENLEKQLNKQTSEVQNIMGYSISTDASFHTRDLSADEKSFASKRGVLHHTVANISDQKISDKTDPTDLSMGTYFQNRCPAFKNVLPHTNSPDRPSMVPSITEVSTSTPAQSLMCQEGNLQDDLLDNIPVRQPRATDTIPTKTIINSGTALNSNQRSFIIRTNAENATVGLCEQAPLVRKPAQYMSQTMYLPVDPPCRKLNTTSKANDLLKKTLQHSTKHMNNQDLSILEAENSYSVSKIAEYLGKESDINITDFIKNHAITNKKKPLTEVQMNIQTKTMKPVEDNEKKKIETTSNANPINTLIPLDRLKISNELTVIPQVVVTQDSVVMDENNRLEIMNPKKSRSRSNSPSKKSRSQSKSPSCKSHSTMSTVQENLLSKSAGSPFQPSKGEVNASRVPSPRTEYKELDKSIDWRDMMQGNSLSRQSFGKDEWVEIKTTPHNGFVGVSCPITISVTTQTETWLTAKLSFDDLPNDGKDLSIELPRFPILLSPKNTEKFALHVTSNVEMSTKLPFTISLKDVSIDSTVEQKGHLEVNFKMPSIQAMSSDGVNKITFPETPENTALVKPFVLFSDCPLDLQLSLTIADGEKWFSIKNIQEIKKGDVNKVLLNRQGSVDEPKSKAMNKQLCRLSSGNALRVQLKFIAPEIDDLTDAAKRSTTFAGSVHVHLIGANTLLRKVDIVGCMGFSELDIKMPTDTVQLTKEPTSLTVSNIGNMTGTWIVKFRVTQPSETFPFKISPGRFEIQPGGLQTIHLSYTGSDDVVTESKISFEDILSGKRTSINITGGTDKPKVFPIKTNRSTMSWVRSGRKELSLKNSSNRKIQIRCTISGEGFSLDVPGMDSTRGAYCLTFAPLERRALTIIFSPSNHFPQAGKLHFLIDKNSEYSRKVRLYGCAANDSVRWFGQVTYGDTALVRAVARAPIRMELINKSASPAFICARVHFNLQFVGAVCVGAGAGAGAGAGVVEGGRRVVGARGRHVVQVAPPWDKVERRAREAAPATALATLTVLTGQEFTRRRIIKILKDNSNGDDIDTSLLPEHLKVLTEAFDGEDSEMDLKIADFDETKESLSELLGGLQELTAQIDLPQDFAEDNTIIINDDTVLDHHTLYD